MKKSIFFFSSFFVFSFFLEMSSRNLIPADLSLLKKIEEFETVRSQVNLLFIGSSHMEKGVDVSFFPNGFNLAHSAQDIYYSRSLLKRYVFQMKSLKVVVMGLPYFSLGYDELKVGNPYISQYYFNLSIPPRHFTPTSYLKLFLYRSHFFSNRNNVVGSVIQRLRSLKEINEGEVVDTLDELDAKRLALNHQMFQDERALVENMNYLFEICELTRKNDVSLFFVTTPVSHDYFHALPDGLKDRFEVKVKLLARKCSKANFLDFSRDERFSSSDFRDPDHLSIAAAKKFSRIISEKLPTKLISK